MSEKEFNEMFSKKLQSYMNYFDITQAELARRLNVSSASVNNWVKGIKSPRMKYVDMMCSIFSCNRSDLIEDKPISEPTPAAPPLRQDEEQFLDLYNQLDQEDKAELRGTAKGMLKSDKYKRKDTASKLA